MDGYQPHFHRIEQNCMIPRTPNLNLTYVVYTLQFTWLFLNISNSNILKVFHVPVLYVSSHLILTATKKSSITDQFYRWRQGKHSMVKQFAQTYRAIIFPHGTSGKEPTYHTANSRWLSMAVCLRKLKQGLYINPEGWDGKGDGREVQAGGDVYTPMADSCWGLTENYKIL